MMTDPPTDDTEAREQDAPDTTDAKHRAPLHGHTGAVCLPTRHSPTQLGPTIHLILPQKACEDG
eukprot:scaffold20139_cov103-Isochrysis_galbana.AAC.2